MTPVSFGEISIPAFLTKFLFSTRLASQALSSLSLNHDSKTNLNSYNSKKTLSIDFIYQTVVKKKEGTYTCKHNQHSHQL